MKPAIQAKEWFNAGVAEADQARLSWHKTRQHLLTAGFNFRKARLLCGYGEWAEFVMSQGCSYSPRTVQLYIQIAEAALEWAHAEKPKLSGDALQEFATSQVMLMSPRPLVELLRSLRELRPFGEYNSVRYNAQKRLGNAPRQVEFNFISVSSQLDLLTHLDEPNYTWKLPEGTDEPTALRDLKAKLETVIEKIDAKLRPVLET